MLVFALLTCSLNAFPCHLPLHAFALLLFSVYLSPLSNLVERRTPHGRAVKDVRGDVVAVHAHRSGARRGGLADGFISARAGPLGRAENGDCEPVEACTKIYPSLCVEGLVVVGSAAARWTCSVFIGRYVGPFVLYPRASPACAFAIVVPPLLVVAITLLPLSLRSLFCSWPADPWCNHPRLRARIRCSNHDARCPAGMLTDRTAYAFRVSVHGQIERSGNAATSCGLWSERTGAGTVRKWAS